MKEKLATPLMPEVTLLVGFYPSFTSCNLREILGHLLMILRSILLLGLPKRPPKRLHDLSEVY
jgi:hypothetical protein